MVLVLNNKYRLPLAFGLALFIHFLMMNMGITKRPVTMPDFHIPRSVNVFLGQTAEPQSTIESQAIKEPIVEQIEAEPVQQKLNKEEVFHVREQAIVDESKNLIMPIDATPEPITIESETPKAEKPLLEKSTTVELPESNIKVDTKQSNVSNNDVDTGQQKIGAVRLARPKYRDNNPPVYPKLARKRGYAGTVILQVLVNKQGRVDDLRIEVSSNHGMLDRAALKAVKKWSFEPGRQGTEKISMWVKVPVTFKLNE